MDNIDDLMAELDAMIAKYEAQPRWLKALREFRRKLYWTNLKYSIRKHTKEKWQRAHRGYSTQDTWNFDMYLAGFLAAALTELRDNSVGHPVSVHDDPRTCFGAKEDCGGEELWRNILTEMIEGFETYHKFDSSNRWEEEEDDAERVDKAFQLLARHYQGLWN